jgi:site-specific recombinase XerD
MSTPVFRVIEGSARRPSSVPFSEQLDDHYAILNGYLDTHITRYHSDMTIEAERSFLTNFFRNMPVSDPDHPDGERQLLIWEAMKPVSGRERMTAFSKGLVHCELSPRTVTRYLGRLRRCFAYVLEWPYIPNSGGQTIQSKYGPIAQPVLEYDYPKHAADKEEDGFVLVGKQLIEFFAWIRDNYVAHNQKKFTAWRDYMIVVVAGTSGLRAKEIMYLDALEPDRDLFYEQGLIQTRFAKGHNGSGPLVRKTLFTPFAQDSMRVYEDRIRGNFPNAHTNPALFLNERGDRVSYDQMWRSVHNIVAAAREAKLPFRLPPRLTLHSLRKSFATDFTMRRPNEPLVLMALMGHSTPGTMPRYVKLPQTYQERAINNLLAELAAEATQQHHREE